MPRAAVGARLATGWCFLLSFQEIAAGLVEWEPTDNVAAQLNCSEGCSVNHPVEWGDALCPDRILTSQADADLWGTCGNFTGNVFIQTNDLAKIVLNGFESIEGGSLIAANCSQLVEISAPNLTYTSGNITLSHLPLLTTVDFPLLEYIEQTLFWDFLPLLTAADIGSEVAGDGDRAYFNGDLSISNTGCMDTLLPTASKKTNLLREFNPLCIRGLGTHVNLRVLTLLAQ